MIATAAAKLPPALSPPTAKPTRVDPEFAPHARRHSGRRVAVIKWAPGNGVRAPDVVDRNHNATRGVGEPPAGNVDRLGAHRAPSRRHENKSSAGFGLAPGRTVNSKPWVRRARCDPRSWRQPPAVRPAPLMPTNALRASTTGIVSKPAAPDFLPVSRKACACGSSRRLIGLWQLGRTRLSQVRRRSGCHRADVYGRVARHSLPWYAQRRAPNAPSLGLVIPRNRVVATHFPPFVRWLVDSNQHVSFRARIGLEVVPFFKPGPGLGESLGGGMGREFSQCNRRLLRIGVPGKLHAAYQGTRTRAIYPAW